MNDFLFKPFSGIVKTSDFTKKLIEKCCAGNRVIDILLHLPSSVCKRTDNYKLMTDKDKLTVILKITDHAPPRYRSSPYKIIGQTQNGEVITIVYFNCNNSHIRKSLPIDSSLTVSGPAQMGEYGIEILHPDVIASAEMFKYYVGIEPVYPLTSKLSNRTITYAVKSIIKIMPPIKEWIPDEFLYKYDLMNFESAIRAAHTPQTIEELSYENAARRRIAIDEILANQIRLKQIRSSLREHITPCFYTTEDLVAKLNLPFTLTNDQLQCLEDIKRDLSSGNPMNRLLQGDVGSGKTIVAFISMLIAIENKAQAVLLSPTEILAQQHFNTIKKLSESLNIKIEMMSSSNKKFRSLQIEKLQSGETQILIGTHAILEENIKFNNLGIIVIDEQHKFGVMQRLSLIQKCQYPNMLTMSATPIPRTLLLGIYGNMDISIIKNKPAGRSPIETIVVSHSKIDSLVEKLKLTDSQIYWVCPVIDESDNLVSVNNRYEYLKKMFVDEEVCVLHGKMKSQEKDHIMTRFKDGKFKLLISTTVIEVGVDIPSANYIVVEHAERFGLAQLHQLRGRVGRGFDKSYCVLLYHFPISDVAKQRLQLMRDTNDGFILSEEDLKLRGAGDIFGKDQSGFYSLKYSDYTNNYQLTKIANDIAEHIDFGSPECASLFKIFKRLDASDAIS